VYSRGASSRKYSSGVRKRIPMLSAKPLGRGVSRGIVLCLWRVGGNGEGGKGGLPVRSRKVLIESRHGDAACGVAYDE
jgi:hypothetical protein